MLTLKINPLSHFIICNSKLNRIICYVRDFIGFFWNRYDCIQQQAKSQHRLSVNNGQRRSITIQIWC